MTPLPPCPQVEAICRAKLAAKLLVSSKEVALSSAKDISGLRCENGKSVGWMCGECSSHSW